MSKKNQVGAISYEELMANLQKAQFKRHYPVFKHHIQPEGLMPDLPQSHAAWYYCMCCHSLFKELDAGQAEYEGELDHTAMFNNQIRSIAALYQLPSPTMIVEVLPYAKMEAERLGIGWDERFESAHLAAYRTRDN